MQYKMLFIRDRIESIDLLKDRFHMMILNNELIISLNNNEIYRYKHDDTDTLKSIMQSILTILNSDENMIIDINAEIQHHTEGELIIG